MLTLEPLARMHPAMITSTKSIVASMTPVRAARLLRLVNLLGSGPKTRAQLIKKLKVEPRGFFRDFEQLRRFGVPIELHEGRYVLLESVATALGRLPFPDPVLSVQEAIVLARGRSAAHKKLRGQIGLLLGTSAGR